MRQRRTYRKRWLGKIALGLAAAAIGVPAAQAAIPGGDSPAGALDARHQALVERTRTEPAPAAATGLDARDPSDVVAVTDGLGRPLEPALVRSGDLPVGTVGSPAPVRPDDRATRTSPLSPSEPQATPVRPDDRAARSSPVTVEQPAPTAVAQPGFDWGDAGVGIGIGVGACLLVLVGVWTALGARRRGHLAGA
jgi:hypothetical protein